MTNSTPNNVFHITVGTASGQKDSFSLERDIRLLKVALLYGDKVKFCSVASSTLIVLLTLERLSPEDLCRVFAVSMNEPKLLGTLRIYEYLKKKKKKRTHQESAEYNQIRAELEKLYRDSKNYFERLATAAGIDDLEVAAKSGLLEVVVCKGY